VVILFSYPPPTDGFFIYSFSACIEIRDAGLPAEALAKAGFGIWNLGFIIWYFKHYGIFQ